MHGDDPGPGCSVPLFLHVVLSHQLRYHKRLTCLYEAVLRLVFVMGWVASKVLGILIGRYSVLNSPATIQSRYGTMRVGFQIQLYRGSGSALGETVAETAMRA